jgi:hypothetical protein
MVPSTRRMRVFGAVDETPLRVPADECPTCGEMVPADGAVECALRATSDTTRPLAAAVGY